MKDKVLKEKFARIGARIKLPQSVVFDAKSSTLENLRRKDYRRLLHGHGAKHGRNAFSRFRQPEFSIDVKNDRQGEYFEVFVGDKDRIEIVDVEPKLRQLLLRVNGNPILAGHDERHLFTCAVPEETTSGGVKKVKQAMVALQPREVQEATKDIRRKNALKRHNRAYKRQGEWFFVPAPDFEPGRLPILKKEPLSRGFGKNHMTGELCRRGGRDVWVNTRYAPQGINEEEYLRHPQRNDTTGSTWRKMKLDPEAYVRGRVWHPDHKTLVLDGWHRVYLNTEGQAKGSRLIRFLD